ncbi:MAG: hypothetical protein HC814_02900, partial [Rhodobacteraceae bacterium]|nr:hypothetical protein [Paracoccaceae bacterium]
MPTQVYPYPIDMAWEVNQDNIQIPHLVNPRTYTLSTDRNPSVVDYDADWGVGTGHRYLFVFLTHSPVDPPTAPTYNGVAMTRVGTSGGDVGLWRLANPATEGDISINVYDGLGGEATMLAVMVVGAQGVAPAFTHQSSGTWNSASPLVIPQSYGSRQSVLTFLQTTAAHGDLTSSTDLLVPRPAHSSTWKLAVALSPPTAGSGTWNTSIAGSSSASGPYDAYGVSLFHVAAQNGTQQPDDMPVQAWSVWAPAVKVDTHQRQALQRLPAQFSTSSRVRGIVSGITSAFDYSSARWANARALMSL